MVLPAGVTRLASSDVAAAAAGIHGTVRVLSVRGPSDRQRHAIWVWRPPGPDSATIPVLYFLHGDPGKARDAFSHGLARALDQWLREGNPPFVVACPDGNGEHHEDSEWADSADGSDLVESRVLDAVTPAVEGTHIRDAAHRAIAGFSMGGYGAVNIAFRHPGMFGQVVSIAGYFHVDDPSGMFGGLPAAIAANSPMEHLQAAGGIRVLLDEDASDRLSLIRGQAEAFGRLLVSAHVQVTVNIQPGEHGWAYAMGALESSAGFLSDGWRQAAANVRPARLLTALT